MLFILSSRWLLYSAVSGVNILQIVLSAFSVRLFCFVQAKLYVGMVVCISCTRACVCRCDGDVICVDHDLNRCARWWYVCSVNLNSVGEMTPSCGTLVLN